MADGEITWSGLTLGGDTEYEVTEIEGWEDLSDISDRSEQRTRGHGDHAGDLFARSRIVTVTGKIVNTTSRDALVRALRSATPVSSVVADLTVDLFGEALTAGARILRRSVKVAPLYVVGEVPFALQWKCPDPLRYGLAQSATTGLPTSGGGLAYPLTYPLDYGATGDPGQVVLSNPGTANAPIVFKVTGSLPSGFEISAAGQRLRYPVDVPAGQTVTIDTGAGTVVVEGTADRRANLAYADWLQVPAGSSLTVQFTSLGGVFDAAATLTATMRPAYW